MSREEYLVERLAVLLFCVVAGFALMFTGISFIGYLLHVLWPALLPMNTVLALAVGSGIGCGLGCGILALLSFRE